MQRIGTQLPPRVLHARAQGERHRHPRSLGAERCQRRRGRELGRHVGDHGSGALAGAHRALGRNRRTVARKAQIERPVLLALQEDGATADLAFDLPALLADRECQGDLAPLSLLRRSRDSIVSVSGGDLPSR